MSIEPRTCVVLPCFNEGFRIAASLATLHSWFGSSTEVLVVDDGSTDDTFERAEHYANAHPHVRIHRIPQHRGKGAAFRAAIPLLRADRVVFVDADLAFDRQSIERALHGLASAEMVIGNRRHHGSYYSVPVRLFGFLHRRHLVGLFFNLLVRALLPVHVRDTQCGLKAFQRAVLVKIAPAMRTDGFAFDVELLLVARTLNVQLLEVPVEVRYESARSSVKLLVSGCAMGLEILKIMVRRARGWYAPTRLRALGAAAVSRPHDDSVLDASRNAPSQ